MKKQLCLLFLAFALNVNAQLSVQITNTPPTSFEAMMASKDTVLVRGTSWIGALGGQATFPIEVRIEQLLNVSQSRRLYAAVLRTRTAGQTIVNYVDYEELDPLLAAMRYIVQADHNATSLENFNASFQTKSGFIVSKYSTDNRNFTALRTSPDAQPNIVDLPAIGELETLLTAAKTKLDTLKRGE